MFAESKPLLLRDSCICSYLNHRSAGAAACYQRLPWLYRGDGTRSAFRLAGHHHFDDWNSARAGHTGLTDTMDYTRAQLRKRWKLNDEENNGEEEKDDAQQKQRLRSNDGSRGRHDVAAAEAQDSTRSLGRRSRSRWTCRRWALPMRLWHLQWSCSFCCGAS